MVESFSSFLLSLSLTSVVRMTFPSPAQVITLTLKEVPWEYMEVGMVSSTDLEIKLS